MDKRRSAPTTGSQSSAVVNGNSIKRTSSKPSSAVFFKDRSQRGDSRGNSVSPVPSADPISLDRVDSRVSVDSTLGDDVGMPLESVSSEYSTDLKSIESKMWTAIKEYGHHKIIDEPCLTLQELNPAPNLLPDLIKVILSLFLAVSCSLGL
jgi:hypothetical protein